VTEVAAAVGHEKVGHTNQGLWHHKGMQLPAFIQHIANDLIKERGMTESRAIATAISMCKKWAAGGKDVKPDTRAKAAAAIAEWEALKAKAKGKRAAAAADAPEFLAASSLTGVELARPGAWKLATGPKTFTEQMLRDAADFYTATGGQGIPVGLGHTDARFDGDPAFGRVTNIRYTTDDRGPVLVGDVVNMTDWLAAAAPKRWPYRSVEGFCDFEYQGRTYSLALTRLALLGATPPAIMDLQTLQDAVAAAAADSGAERITATPVPDDLDPDDLEILREVEVEAGPESAPLNPPTLPDPGTEASPLLATTPPTQEGAGMDPAKLREAVGALKPDASEEEVMAALASAGLKVAASAPPSNPPPQPSPSTPANPTVDPADQPDQTPASPPSKPTAGTVVMDASQLEEIKATAARMRVLEARLQADDRDKVITDAIRVGKFPQARRAHWEKAWAADPDGTKATIESLAANLVPLAASGYQGDPDAEFDLDYSSLYPPEVKSRG
jgi:hypothetical protein